MSYSGGIVEDGVIANTGMTEDVDKKEDKAAHEGIGKGLKDNSLKAAGITYLVADALLAAARFMEGDKFGFGGVALWGAGGVVTGVYGNPKAEKKLQLLERRLGEYLKKQNVEIPKNPTTAELTKKGGVIDNLESFLYTYPSQILNTAFAVGGALMVRGGIKNSKTGERTYTDIAAGTLVTLGALSGLLIPEKSPDTDHPAKGFAAKTWEWAQANPLRVSSSFYHANNAVLIGSVIEKKVHKKYTNNKSPWVRLLAAATYITANVFLSKSSKDNINVKDEQKNTEVADALAKISAQIIAAQSKETQEVLIQNLAGYLSAQPEIKKTAPEIAQLLHDKLATIQQPEMLAAGKWQSHIEKAYKPQLLH